jgi:TRAP-type mannitol/chloroaromatic compound transport system permease small subunit
MLEFMASIMRAINTLNREVGRVFSWLALAIVLVCFSVVVERYFFNNTRLWAQDLYVWLNGFMFTAVAGFALLRDDHVRVDIFYRPGTIRHKAICDAIGVLLFLFPFMFVVIHYGLPFVLRSWRILENSANIGGMPGLYLLKTFILVFGVLMILQGIAMLIRSVLVLMNRDDLIPANYRYLTQAQATGKE